MPNEGKATSPLPPALHVERCNTYYYQTYVADAGVSQQAAQIGLLQRNHGSINKSNRPKDAQHPGIFDGCMGR